MEKTPYKYLIFDADHTLIDFDADERRAFFAAFGAAGIKADTGTVEDCWEFSWRNWEGLGLNDVHTERIQREYHALYREHVRALFDYADEKFGFCGKREEAEAEFVRSLCVPAHCVDGAEEVLRVLSEKYVICAATNGLSEMQRGRLSALSPYLRNLFVSEEMGFIKPNVGFFRAVTDELGASAKECLMVGDSLTSDVAGAQAAGMDCVWFNRRQQSLPEGFFVKAEITHLKDLLKLL